MPSLAAVLFVSLAANCNRKCQKAHCQLQKALPCPNAPDACMALHRVACHFVASRVITGKPKSAAARGVSACFERGRARPTRVGVAFLTTPDTPTTGGGR